MGLIPPLKKVGQRGLEDESKRTGRWKEDDLLKKGVVLARWYCFFPPPLSGSKTKEVISLSMRYLVLLNRTRSFYFFRARLIKQQLDVVSVDLSTDRGDSGFALVFLLFLRFILYYNVWPT